MNGIHIPVMVNEVCEYLPENARVIIDLTLGHGGHTNAIREYYHNRGTFPELYGVDRDEHMLQKAQQRLGDGVHYIHGSYRDVELKADFVLADLGVNMDHFKVAERGFSIKLNGPLDMRFDTRSEMTAHTIIHTFSAAALAELFQKYGDFDVRLAKYVVDLIIDYRKTNTFETTGEFANYLRKNKINDQKLAIIFQCLRIETNQELEHLQSLLNKLPLILSSGGIAAILTYHSIEDRIVKYHVLENSELSFVTKHVIKPTYQETQKNPAARSAKLRIIQRL